MTWMVFILIVFALSMIGFLSGIEFGFLSANKLSIELKKKHGNITGKIWGMITENPSKFIASIVLGLNVCVVLFTLLIDESLSSIFNSIKSTALIQWLAYFEFVKIMAEVLFLGLIVLTVITFFRAIFKVNSDAFIHTKTISKLTNIILGILSPIAWAFVRLSEWMLMYIFNIKISTKKEAFNKVDLAHFLHQLESREPEDHEKIEKELFENALLLSEKKVRVCLIPRKEIEGVDTSCTVLQLKNKFIDTKLSKIIVYDKSIDHIVGYVHHLDLFKKPLAISEIIHPIFAVPESMAATDLLNKFSMERKSIAWVIDEFGGTSGIITIEDILEEIFGEIEDEYDTPKLLIEEKLSDTEFIFSGRTELDYIVEKYSLLFQDSKNTETLSGYVVQKNQSIPKQHDIVIIGKLAFEVLQVNETNIETIKVKVLQ